jgi:hypothetical protein
VEFVGDTDASRTALPMAAYVVYPAPPTKLAAAPRAAPPASKPAHKTAAAAARRGGADGDTKARADGSRVRKPKCFACLERTPQQVFSCSCANMCRECGEAWMHACMKKHLPLTCGWCRREVTPNLALHHG